MFVYDYIGADMGIFGTWSLELTLSECPNQQPVFGRANNDFMSLIQDNNGNNEYAFIEFIGLNVIVSILTTLLVITMVYCICCGKLNKNKF